MDMKCLNFCRNIFFSIEIWKPKLDEINRKYQKEINCLRAYVLLSAITASAWNLSTSKK